MGIDPSQFEEMKRRVGMATDPQIRREAAVENEIRDLHRPILAWCHDQGVPCAHTNPSKKSRATPGCPDFIIGYKGRTYWIECKDDEGELSPAQLAFARMLQNQNITMAVVTNFQQFLELLRQTPELKECDRRQAERNVQDEILRKCMD